MPNEWMKIPTIPVYNSNAPSTEATINKYRQIPRSKHAIRRYVVS